MAVELSKIANNMVRSVASGELCRLWATELSEIKPQLDAKNVTLAGVGLEDLGLDEFVKGEYFKGDLYIDAEKNNYKALEFKRYNVFTIVPSLATKETRNSVSKSNLKKITGNYKGDGWQNGGLIIVAGGGEKVLLNFKQKSPGDHLDNDAILNALGIASAAAQPATEGDKAEGETKGEEETAADDEGKKTEAEGETAEKPAEDEGCGPPAGGGC